MCRATAVPSSRRHRGSVRPTAKDAPVLPEVCKDADPTRPSTQQRKAPRGGRRPVLVGGDVLDDYVVFPQELGRGHYGVVRECLHRRTRKAFACKSIDKSRIRRWDHLRNEVEIMFEVDHPSVVRMEDVYEDRDYVHIVTEKCDGGELFDEIVARTTTDRGTSFSEERAATIVRSLLEAVAHLHDRDVVHRDIKPENVLLETSRADSPVRLIDFGLSRRHRRGDPPMTNPVGTAYYMAPELLGKEYDRACDLWSIGTVAYILLCGHPPFNGDTDADIFEAIRRGGLRFPAAQWGHRSAEAKDLIECLLRMDPRKRFTAKEALRHPWIENLGKRPATKPQRRRGVRSARGTLRSMFKSREQLCVVEC